MYLSLFGERVPYISIESFSKLIQKVVLLYSVSILIKCRSSEARCSFEPRFHKSNHWSILQWVFDQFKGLLFYERFFVAFLVVSDPQQLYKMIDTS